MTEVFRVPSSKDNGVKYNVCVDLDTKAVTCNCPAGSYDKPCRHKDMVVSSYYTQLTLSRSN